MRRVALSAPAALLVAVGALVMAPARARADDGLSFALGEHGEIGAMMLQGPYPASAAPRMPVASAPWKAAMNRMGVVDVTRGKPVSDAVVFARLTLDVSEAGRYVAMLGADDGAAVLLDGTTLYERDVARPMREDDDMVPLSLSRGRHELLLRLHQRAGAWTVKLRLVREDLRAASEVRVVFPRDAMSDADVLALSSVVFQRRVTSRGVAPHLVVQLPAGFPSELVMKVHASLRRGETTLFSAPIGDARVVSGLARDLDVALPELSAADVEGGARLVLEVGSRTLTLPIVAPGSVLTSIAAARAELSRARDAALDADTRATLELLATRLERFVGDGDTDSAALEMEAAELARVVSEVARGGDGFAGRTGAMRRGYFASADGAPQEVAVYVPPGYDSRRKYPLVVALHGLDGYPMAMLRWFFGKDEAGRDQAWEERHPTELPTFGAIVIAPYGHGNTMYREQGEDDVLSAIAWAKRHYAIDPSEITITGPSMGGMGAAAIPLHHPDLFAAAAPLCGYHSYFLRGDIASFARRPWEELVAEERSNVLWAENGRALPLYIVHGTRDLPVANSQVLIDRYEALHYSVVHEHPDLGHNVWQTSYEGMKLGTWLLRKHRTFDDAHVVFKTTGPREGAAGFVHIDAKDAALRWASIDARRTSSAIVATTTNVREVHFDRPDHVAARGGSELRVTLDGATLSFASDEGVAAHRDADGWKKGPIVTRTPVKRGRVAGPLRDVFREPVLFVYGAKSPVGAIANETVAKFFARGKDYVSVRYPVMSDAEFLARGERLDAERALFLVGNAAENALVAALDQDFPIRVDGGAVTLGARSFRSAEVGAAFIMPNPRNPAAYVVVIEAPTPLGTMRAMSLPDILPDYAVYDRAVAPSRGQLILGMGTLLAGGMFENDWSLK